MAISTLPMQSKAARWLLITPYLFLVILAIRKSNAL